MNEQELREKIISLGPWHHDVEVALGVRTGTAAASAAPPGTYPAELGTPTLIDPERVMKRIFEDIYQEGLAGRTVLDCACNAGGYLFASAQLGAGQSFGFDVREHWIKQARFLSENLPSENIEFAQLDLMALPARNLEPFDVTLFMGIFYHLPDPIAGLRIAADHTRELLVLNTAMVPPSSAAAEENGAAALVVNCESTAYLMSGVHGLAWLPANVRVLQDILAWCGFPHTRLDFDRTLKAEDRRRVQLLAARDESTFAHYDGRRGRQRTEKKAAASSTPPRFTKKWTSRLFRRAR